MQAVLGHADPRITEERYSSMREVRMIEQAKRLDFGAAAYPAPRSVARVLRQHPKTIGEDLAR